MTNTQKTSQLPHFDAKAPGNCYWGVFFNDKDGKMLGKRAQLDILIALCEARVACHI